MKYPEKRPSTSEFMQPLSFMSGQPEEMIGSTRDCDTVGLDRAFS